MFTGLTSSVKPRQGMSSIDIPCIGYSHPERRWDRSQVLAAEIERIERNDYRWYFCVFSEDQTRVGEHHIGKSWSWYVMIQKNTRIPLLWKLACNMVSPCFSVDKGRPFAALGCSFSIEAWASERVRPATAWSWAMLSHGAYLFFVKEGLLGHK
jgi:hypothetical protein